MQSSIAIVEPRAVDDLLGGLHRLGIPAEGVTLTREEVLGRSSARGNEAIPAGFDIDSTVLGSLTTVNSETIAVALAAGVAGMLALETRASSGVGVAVSVTTIPAAAYLGVALGLGERGEALGALAVLSTNVAMLVIGASATLLLQRAAARGAGSKRERETTTA